MEEGLVFHLILCSIINKAHEVFEEFNILGTFECVPHKFLEYVA